MVNVGYQYTEQFLTKIREDWVIESRKSKMIVGDKELEQRMARKSKKIELQEKYRKRSKQGIETLYETVELSSGGSNPNDATDSTDDDLRL